jgi:hypothetical protein
MPTRLARILVLSLAVLALTSSAGAGTHAAAGAPSGLHPFLLRVDEPRADSFSRTPAFAWNPVSGAVRYEFQLSTSNAFRESGIVFSDTSLTSPVVSPALTLPWITGSPHALYARVRAVLADTTTAWSSSFGFDMQPPTVPSPLPSAPGLLRWTPVDGAAGYQVWFVDLPKMISVTTNVADEREFYSFHQAASWLSSVRWRIRAMRNDFNGRANGLPAVTYGPWSPVYTAVNPPFSVGAIKPAQTISDVASTGVASGPAHRLMPAFVYGGNQSLAAVTGELYRVHVFTDKGCVNRVYSSAIVGSPAYAPRASGPLALPRDVPSIAAARAGYLPDGDEGPSFAADLDKVMANESLPDVVPTTGLPGGTLPPAAGTTPSAPAGGAAPAPAPAAPAAPGAAPANVELIKAGGNFGPPVDLWDTDWQSGGGYYWTVVPVEARVPGASSTSVAGAGTAVGATTLPVSNSAGFAVGDAISVGSSGNSEVAAVTSVAAGSLGVAAALKFAHGAGEPVARTSGNIQYRDVDLAQDSCAAGRVLRFGKESEPALTSGGEPFASGLSPTGKLQSASATPRFYGSPLVAWTTALSAEVYAIQWSKTKQPFKPETDPATGALGMMTLNTSVVLPLTPGTWYYRVRGYDYSLPTNAQAMSWSDPQAILVTKPTFEIVSGDTTARTRRLSGNGFSVSVPTSWSATRKPTKAGPRLAAIGSFPSVVRLAARGADAALFVQSAPDGSSTQTAWSRKQIARMKALPNRTSAPVTCRNVSLPAGAAVRCSLSTRVAGGRQAAVVYLLRHRSATYTLTFASAVGAGRSATFAAAARSFRFTS